MGFEACHPAVNFIFFAAAIYGAVSFKHPVFLAIAYVCAFVYSIKRWRQAGGDLQLMSVAADSGICAVLQLLSPFRCHSAETELHRQPI